MKTREALKEAMRGKVNKSDADYHMDRMWRYDRCGRCEHFIPAKTDADSDDYDGPKALGECQIVWGNIDPLAWCKYFEPRGEKAETPTATVPG